MAPSFKTSNIWHPMKVLLMHISALSKRRGGWGDGVFVRERGEGRIALWSTQPHYSVYRTAHPLHCSSNQPKLTGLIRSPQSRTELLYVLKGAADEISRMISQECGYCLFFNALQLSSTMIWFPLRTSFVISNSKWYKDDTNMRERCLTDMFWAVWFPQGRAERLLGVWRAMVKDLLGVVSRRPRRRGESFPEMWTDFITWGTVRHGLLCCSMPAWQEALLTNNTNTKRPAHVGPPTGVSCKYALTILLQPHQSWRIWQGPFVPHKECKHSWSML